MGKYNSLISSILWFLAKLVIFCSLWLLYAGHPFMQNLFGAIALFLGSEFLIYCTKKSSIKSKENDFIKETFRIRLKGIKRFHIGTLSSDKIVLLYDFLHNHVDCPIEIMNNK